ncbi:MAG: type II toxin-antitoxin system RelB/DinJ family antitoxin [Opitutaceae bacterium]|jgi:addiction module RelB/DinJ family antitoxin
MATIQIRTRIDRKLKKKSDAVLRGLGLDAGSFVSMALTQLVNRRGLPFAVTESDASYFASEYGLTAAQAFRAGAAMKKEAAHARRSGKLREVKEPADLTP